MFYDSISFNNVCGRHVWRLVRVMGLPVLKHILRFFFPGATGQHTHAVSRAAGVFAAILVLLATCLSGTALYVRSTDALRSEVRSNLANTALMLSTLVDGDRHKTFHTPHQEYGREYAQAVAPLRRVLHARKDIRYIYTFARDADGFRFVLDAAEAGDGDGDGVDDKSHIGERYDAPPDLVQAFDTKRPRADASPTTDEWGTFVSGYAPIFDRAGRLSGIIGVDMTATEYVQRLNKMRSAAYVGFALALGVSIGIGILVCRLTGTIIAARNGLEARVADRTQELARANAALAGVNTDLVREARERERAVTALRVSEQQLSHQAFHDALTGLPNRALFLDRLQTALARSRSRGKPIGVAFLDVDNFKLINDSLGHEQGDFLLREVAARLVGCLRAGDTVARLGGDEFTVLLEDLADSSLSSVIERIIKALHQPIPLSTREVFISASIGVVVSDTGGGSMGIPTPDSLLRDADTAMYRAKQKGKATWVLFDAAMSAQAVERMELESDLRWALERRELLLYYQPIVSLESGALTGVEALLRWEHPRLGLLPPVRFVPIAEETGLIVPIGRWVLEEACRQMRVWGDEHPDLPRLVVSVNVSARQLYQAGFFDEVKSILDATGIFPGCLKLEITESIMMGNTEATIDMLTHLRSLGVLIAIDDFGTGYSSMAYLSRFPLDTIKIDRSFIKRLQEKEDDGVAIIQAIIQMARSLNLNVTSEGIETEAQLVRLQDLGCQEGQGFLWARPLSAWDASQLIASANYAGSECDAEATRVVASLRPLLPDVERPEREAA